MANYIDDFGQKIGGAKKDLWRTRGLKIEDLDDIDLREYLEFITKENIWPTPNYMEYVKNGMEPVCTYFMKTIRDKVQAKTDVYGDGADRDRAEKYIRFILDIKESCELTRTQKDIEIFYKILIINHGYYSNEGWTPKSKGVPGIENNFIRFTQFSSSEIENLYYETVIQGFPESFRGDLKGSTIKKSYFDNNYYIVKGSKKLIKNAFATVDEALEFVKDELKDIMDGKKNTKKKESKTIKVIRPQLVHVQRTGPDLRQNYNASTEHLIRAFKFRGGEFGNWTNQDDRQAYTNYAFDAMMDLAYVLKSPLEFLSFHPTGSYGGKCLAIAFGARGSGQALAHYECGRVVINLTKLKGAGCLAHEWGHALDDYLGVKCGIKGTRTFLSGKGYSKVEVNKDIADAFSNVMKSMKEKERPAEEILVEYKKEVDKYLNRILKSWINPMVTSLTGGYSDKRRSATEEEMERINKHLDNMYKTGDRKYYDMVVGMFKEIKGVLPNKDIRDHAESILNHVKYILEAIEKFDATGEFEHRGTKDTDYYRCAKELDKSRKESYYAAPWEMFARAFEAYVEDSLGFKSQYLVHSTSNGCYSEDMKPYPDGEERQVINNAIEELLRVTVDRFAKDLKQFDFNRIYGTEFDKSNKYSKDKMLPHTTEKTKKTDSNKVRGTTIEQPKEISSKEISNGIILVYAAYDKDMDNNKVHQMSDNIDKLISTSYEIKKLGFNVKYKDTSGGRFTCIIYDGFIVSPKPIAYKGIINNIREQVITKLKAKECLVRIINPELSGLEKMADSEISRYRQIVTYDKGKLEHQVDKEPEVEQKEKEIENTADLRQKLVAIAKEASNGTSNIPYSQIYRHLIGIAFSKLNLGKIVEGDVSYKQAQGNSKAWKSENGVLIISKNESIEKKLEGTLEPIIKVIIIRKYGNTPETAMVSDAVTYMVCKQLGIDVRTYCLTDGFERLVKNKAQITPFTNVVKQVYSYIIQNLKI